MNKHEIRCFALKRSGHHAVLYWILKAFDGPTCFVNDCRAHEGPIRRRVRWGGPAAANDCYMYNFEHFDISGFQETDFAAFRRPCDRFRNLVVLRDPYNWAASLLQWLRARRTPAKLCAGPLGMPRWLAYAREFVGEGVLPADQTVCVSYNQWLGEPAYRRLAAQRLGIAMADADADELTVKSKSGLANGIFRRTPRSPSSFRGPGDMLDRWRRFAADPDYLALFDDPEVARMSERIFGPGPLAEGGGGSPLDPSQPANASEAI